RSWRPGEAKAHPADRDMVARDSVSPPRRGGANVRHVPYGEVKPAQSLAAAVAIRDEAQEAEIERDFRRSGGAAAEWAFQDLAPAPGDALGIGSLGFRGEKSGGGGGAARVLPIWSGRMIGAVKPLAARCVVELQHRAPGIARVELEPDIGAVIEGVGDADADLGHVPAAPLDIIAIDDQHIAAIAAPPLEIA